jgi:hypothetical protein
MIELGYGLFIETSQELHYQQEGWHEDDRDKNINFREYPYWLTTDDGEVPKGFASIENIEKELIEIGDHDLCLLRIKEFTAGQAALL